MQVPGDRDSDCFLLRYEATDNGENRCRYAQSNKDLLHTPPGEESTLTPLPVIVAKPSSRFDF